MASIGLSHLVYNFLQINAFFWTAYIVLTGKVQNQNPISAVENTIKFQVEVDTASEKNIEQYVVALLLSDLIV